MDVKAFLVCVFWSGRPGGSDDGRGAVGGCQEVSMLRVLERYGGAGRVGGCEAISMIRVMDLQAGRKR